MEQLTNERSVKCDEAAGLYDYETGEWLRHASLSELQESAAAALADGGAGVIRVDGRRCYAKEER